MVQRTGNGHTCRVLGGQAIERSGDTVCDLHRARGDEECRFLGWASKLRLTVCQWFGLKTTQTVSWLSLKTKVVEGFPVWASKPAATVWWFGSQNHHDDLLVWDSKPSRLWFVGCATKPMGGCDGMGHASRSSGLLRVEASLAKVSQSGLKTGGDMTAGGARGTIAEVASESSWRRTGRCVRLRWTLLPLLYRFHSIMP
jgi:hypothetical protein